MSTVLTPAPLISSAELAWMRSLCTDPVLETGPYQMPPFPALHMPPQGLVLDRLAVLHRGVLPDLVVRRVPEAVVRHALATFFLRPVVGVAVLPLEELRRWCELPMPSRTPCLACGGAGSFAFSHPDEAEEAAVIAKEDSEEADGATVTPVGIGCDACGSTGWREERSDGYGKIGALVIDRRELTLLLSNVRGGLLEMGNNVMLGVAETLDYSPRSSGVALLDALVKKRSTIHTPMDFYLGADEWRARLYPVDYTGVAPGLPGM